MQSISKTPVTLETARQIAAAHLGSDLTEFHELTEGFFNAAYFLRLANNCRCVLKVAPPASVTVLRYEKNILAAEVTALLLVREQTQLPVPAIFVHDESGILLPSPFFLMEFIEGEPLHKLREKLSQEEQSVLDRQIGAYLREMNAIRGSAFGPLGQPTEQCADWPSAFARLFANVLTDGRAAKIDLPYERLQSIPTRYAGALAEVTTPHLVHWDLWDGNIFIHPQTRQISGIIDFERALWADPLMECNFGAFGMNENFFAGYGQTLPFDPGQTTRRKLYNIYLYLIMVIECAYRQYPTQDQENWARGMLQKELDSLTNDQLTD